MNPRSVCCSLLLAAFSLFGTLSAPSAHATLRALASTQATGQTALAAIDPLTATLSSASAQLDACCEFSAGSVAADAGGGVVYALSPDSGGELRLIRFGLSGGAAVVGTVGSGLRAVALEFDTTSQTLVAALTTAAGPLQLQRIDPATGAGSVIHAGSSNCCVLEPGLSALQGQTLVLLGRLRDDPDTPRLIRLSTTGDQGLSTPPLAAPLGAVASDPQSGLLYGLRQDAGLVPPSAQLVRIANDGGFTPIGAVQDACCALAGGTALISAGQLYVVGATLPGLAPAILSVVLDSGSFQFSTSALAGGINVLGFLPAAGAPPPTITLNIVSIAPSPVTQGQSYVVTVSVSDGSGTPAGTVVVDDGQGHSCLITLPANSCALTAGTPGNLSITASYAGAGSASASSQQTLLVLAAGGLVSEVPLGSAGATALLALLLAASVLIQRRARRR